MSGANGDLGPYARTAILCGALVVAVVAVVAVAPAPTDAGCDEVHSGLAPIRQGRYRVVERLRLSRSQREAWGRAWRHQVDSLRPTLDNVNDLRAKLREELASDEPDAATVGAYMIEIRGLAATLGATRGELEGALLQILDDEQRLRYEELTSLRSSG